MAQEELYTPKTGTAQSAGDLFGHILCVFQHLRSDGCRLEAFTVVAALLNVADRLAEQRRTVFLSYGKQGDLAVERNELLHDHFLQVATGTLTGAIPGLGQFVGTVYLALTVTGRAHQRLDDTGEADFCCSSAEFLIIVGIAVVGCFQSQFRMSQFADFLAVHGVVYRLGARNYLNAHFLCVVQHFGADRLDFRHDDVRLVFADGGHQGFAVEHTEHLTLVGHLHCRCVPVGIASDDILSLAFAGNDKFLAQFSGSQ